MVRPTHETPAPPQWLLDERADRRHQRRRRLWQEACTACAALLFGFAAGVLVCAGII